MNELQIFKNPAFGQIRAVEIDGEPWLVGKDTARALGYKDTDQALRKHVEEEDKLTRRFDGSGQNREMTIINESGVYSLIFSSRLPDAKKFKRWVTSEVLPSIRKTGTYSIPEPVLPGKPQPEVSLAGLAKVANTARRAVLDMGGSRWEAGAEVLQILDYCGLPVPEFAKSSFFTRGRLNLADFF